MPQEDSATFDMIEKSSNRERGTEKLITGQSDMVVPVEQLDRKEVKILKKGQVGASAFTIRKKSAEDSQNTSFKIIPKPISQVLLSRVASDEHLRTDPIQRLSHDLYLNQFYQDKQDNIKATSAENERAILQREKPSSNEASKQILQLGEPNDLLKINDKNSIQRLASSIDEDSFIHPPSPIH